MIEIVLDLFLVKNRCGDSYKKLKCIIRLCAFLVLVSDALPRFLGLVTTDLTPIRLVLMCSIHFGPRPILISAWNMQ